MRTNVLAAAVILSIAAAGVGSLAAPGRACTCFTVQPGGSVLVGRNYDWDFSDGLVLVNKRNLEKSAGVDEALDSGKWRARYGSLTFNQYGREFPTGGVNEKGLVVEVLWLQGTVFPPADYRMELQSVQWIQYQLDTAATIEEVIASLAKVRVAGTTPIHFFIADRSGATASVEFLDGKPAVHRTDAAAPGGAGGDPMSVPVLTNHTYEDSRSFLNTCAGWGGSETIPDSPASLHRFARAATGLRSLQSLSRITGPADAFKILDGVAQEGATQWSIVYDLSALRVHFRTLGHQDVKTIDLADLDFACDTPVRMIDIDTAGAGNVRERWTDYTRAANRDLIGRAYGKTDFLKGVPPETLDLLAMYPEGARCAGDPR